MKKKICLLTTFVFIIDQVLKILISTSFRLQEVKYLIPDFFYLTYVENIGGAWSVFSNIPYLLIGINVLFLGIMIQYIIKRKTFQKLEILEYGLILGGVLGNLIDRIRLGGVVDYIGLKFGSYHYPIFNFADMMIVFGVVLIMVETIKDVKK